VRSLDRFDRGRPFGPWLHRIVVNRAIDWARARVLRGEVGGEALAAAPAGNPGHGVSDEVVAALASLPEEQRAVIVLRHLLDYTPGEIAELLELPRGTVNSRLRRGLDELAERLER
jgi:RNA polymerase sigma-70 factor, ECF subfamily